jgi:glutathione synthase
LYYKKSLDVNDFAEILPNLQSTIRKRKDIITNNLEKFWDWAQLMGCLYTRKKDTEIVTDHMPLTLFPTIIPLEEYNQLQSISLLWNSLVNGMSRDFDWFSQKLTTVIETDDFVKRLMEIAEKSRRYQHTQQIQLAIMRNDFMYDTEESRWLQVEYNTIASGMAYSSDKVQDFHNMILQQYFEEDSKTIKCITAHNGPMVCAAFIEAFKLYNNPKAKILFVVEKFEWNIFDQRYIELDLLKKGIHCLRMDLETIYEKHKLDEETGKLTIDGQEIALVYFRSGYAPKQYPSENAWIAREKIELSKAIKCPNVNMQLIGFKKFQYHLAHDIELSRFIKNPEDRLEIKRNFAKFWSFDDEAKTERIKKMVDDNPEGFVLKPQREGGGNNVYGADILPVLTSLKPSESQSYILMQRITPVSQTGFMMKNKKLMVTQVSSELGIFSYVLSNNEKIIKSESGGYLLRTKSSASDEGGVSAGVGVLDSLAYQISEEESVHSPV